jgi:hypothetical protein
VFPVQAKYLSSRLSRCGSQNSIIDIKAMDWMPSAIKRSRLVNDALIACGRFELR